MKRTIIIFLFLSLAMFSLSAKQVIRIDRNDFNRLPLKGIDIAGTNPKEGWMDIVVDDTELAQIKIAGINYTERVVFHPEAKAVYMSADEILDSLTTMALNFPSIVRLDTIAWSSSDSFPLVYMKISDNPNVDEYDEPAALFVGMHHSREWQTPGTVLFFADSLLREYAAGDTTAIKYINDLEIYLSPLVNPEGYMYSRTTDNYWRKTRIWFPEYGTYGVDPNRNYGVSGPPLQSWGTTVNSATTHLPSDDVYCGPRPFTGTEAAAVKDVIISHPNIYLSVTYHSYSELVIYPWGSTTDTTIHNTQMKNFSEGLASRLTKRDGSGTYDPGQSVGLYPTTGDMTDWAYGYCLYVLGRGHFSVTVEEDTQFQPSESDLYSLYADQYKGFLYVLAYADSMINYPSYRIEPIPLIDSVSATYNDSSSVITDISWQDKEGTTATNYALKRYENLTKTSDSFNSLSLWNNEGFILDDSHTPYTGTYTAWSDSAADIYTAISTKLPVHVLSGDSLSFYANYSIEENYDAAYIEISDNGYYWELINDTLGVLTGTTGDSWQKYTYLIPDKYNDKYVYFRFRYSTDDGTEYKGILIDSVSLVGTVTDSQIIDTLIAPTKNGIYTDNTASVASFYSVKGKNDKGWGLWSIPVQSEYSLSSPILHYPTNKLDIKNMVTLMHLPIKNVLPILYRCDIPVSIIIKDITGRTIDKITIPKGEGSLTYPFKYAAGTYFLLYNDGNKKHLIKFNKIN